MIHLLSLALIMVSLLQQGAFALAASAPKVALVTGANKGIGKEIARKFTEAGITTILACRTNGKETAAELNCKHSCYLDLTDDESIAQCAAYVQEHFGHLDILCNNAAICFNDPTLYGKVAHTPFERQAAISVQTNFFGTFKLTNKLLPLLQNSSSPKIINIASNAGRLAILKSREKVALFTDPTLTTDKLEQHMLDFVRAVETGVHAKQGWANTCYGMSKLGIIAFTKILARDHPEIMVNSVDPGYCATDQNNMQGFRPAERGAVSPLLLATTEQKLSGKHWFDEKEIAW
jgi:carbonyl reductase 1